jgi:hypothetical protein
MALTILVARASTKTGRRQDGSRIDAQAAKAVANNPAPGRGTRGPREARGGGKPGAEGGIDEY